MGSIYVYVRASTCLFNAVRHHIPLTGPFLVVRYAEIKDYLQAKGEKLKTRHIIAAGISAGAVTALVTNPIWVIKTRMQVQLAYPDSVVRYTGMFGTYRECAVLGSCMFKAIDPRPRLTFNSDFQYFQLVADAIRRMHAEEGLRVFYKGIVPALLASYHSAVQFLIYENATGLVQNSVHTAHPVRDTSQFLRPGVLIAIGYCHEYRDQ